MVEHEISNASNMRKIQMTLEGHGSYEDWTFAKANTTYLVHKLHEYPARMIPQIAERLIQRYSPTLGTILDPFCGSGTTLVEARLANRSSVGNDVNALAILVARVKSNPLDFVSAGFEPSSFFHALRVEYEQEKRNGDLPEPPLEIMPNLLHWFKKAAARDLEFLFRKIMQVENENVRDFLKVVFSDTVFKSSNIDHRSSRFIRTLHKEELAKFKPDVLEHFQRKLFDSATRMFQYCRKLRESKVSGDLTTTVRKGDARDLGFSADHFDAAITSPPYGEEKNTIGYTRWSKLSMAWLRLNSHVLNESERMSLGGVTSENALRRLNDLRSPTAAGILREISKTDLPRVNDALPFFFDYGKTMKEIHRVLKREAYYCIVIGDRSIRKKLVDMERVTVELGTAAGFTHVKSYFRTIPMKLIPWTTPTGKTISRESIIILQKK